MQSSLVYESGTILPTGIRGVVVFTWKGKENLLDCNYSGITLLSVEGGEVLAYLLLMRD